MNQEYYAFIGYTLDVIGKILIAYTAVMVHHRVWQEHKIDNRVFDEMKKEKLVAFIGIFFILLGYFLQLPSKLPFSP
ncbi:hypothetical protein ACFL1M_01505 [Patescibacteria group bacterium]